MNTPPPGPGNDSPSTQPDHPSPGLTQAGIGILAVALGRPVPPSTELDPVLLRALDAATEHPDTGGAGYGANTDVIIPIASGGGAGGELGAETVARHGLGLTGAGAEAAARAAITVAVAGGGPARPGWQARVWTDTATLARLTGLPAAGLASRPALRRLQDAGRLTIHPDLAELLNTLDQHLVEGRHRHVQDSAPSGPQGPLLIVTADHDTTRTRLRTALTTDTPLPVAGLILDPEQWPVTIVIDTDGHMHPPTGPGGQPTVYGWSRTQRRLADSIAARLSAPACTRLLDLLTDQPRPAVTQHDTRNSATHDRRPATAPTPASTATAAAPGASTTPPGTGIRVEVLCPKPRILINNTLIDGPARRATDPLLAWLAVHRAGGTAGRIGTQLWPDDDTDHTNVLYQLVADIRRAVRAHTGAPILITARRVYRLAPGVTTDLDQFTTLLDINDPITTDAAEAIHTAAALYRSDLYADGDDGDWAAATRAALRGQITAALRALADAWLPGHPDRAAAELDRLLAIDPLSDTTWQQLIRLHHQAGHTDQIRTALQVMQARYRLAGLPPDPGSIALAQQLLPGTGRQSPPSTPDGAAS